MSKHNALLQSARQTAGEIRKLGHRCPSQWVHFAELIEDLVYALEQEESTQEKRPIDPVSVAERATLREGRSPHARG